LDGGGIDGGSEGGVDGGGGDGASSIARVVEAVEITVSICVPSTLDISSGDRVRASSTSTASSFEKVSISAVTITEDATTEMVTRLTLT